MLWLCLSLPQLPLESCSPPSNGCVAIADHKGARRWLVACNERCAENGVHAGQDATTALGLCPELQIIARSRRHEREALKALAIWAGQFSGFISFDAERLLLWLEIGSSLRYFGGLPVLEEKVMESLGLLGYSAYPGIASTPEAAALSAYPGTSHRIEEQESLRDRLSPFLLRRLALPASSLSALQESGLRTIAEILALPRASLARRFGPETTLYLARLLGEVPHPLPAYRAPDRYQRRFDFFGAIETVEGLLFPLKRILGELEGYLRSRDTAIQDLKVVFTHERHASTTLQIRTTMPLRDAAKLLALLRERLERVAFVAAIEGVTVSAERFVPLGDTQLDLLDAKKHRNTAWAGLLDKLKARLGNDAVHHLGLRDDHRPEQAWCVIADQPQTEIPSAEVDRPLWLLQSRKLSHLPRIIGKPERIEGGWWQGQDVSRDYYIADSPDGSRLWLYKDLTTGHWHLQGLWA